MANLPPAMEALAPLVGTWKVRLTWSETAHAIAGGPKTVNAQARMERVHEDRFLHYWQGARKGPPSSHWLIGHDDDAKEYSVLYGDDRPVSRVYRMTFKAGVWRIWREAPGFYQRFEGRLMEGGRTIQGAWENSKDGKKWVLDFDLVYSKT